ncbi:MAG: methyltransferase domain-containing protein [Cyanobacteriota bacterium]
MNLEKLRIRRIGDSFSSLLKDNSSILDIGCGNGNLGEYLILNKNIFYHGVDIIKNKNLSNITFTKSSFPYPFEDKSFDTVIIILTLHHFDNPENGLKEAVRLAKNNILLLEDVPRNNLERNLMKLIDFIGNKWVSKDIPIPFNFYSDEIWQSLFIKYKLKLKSRKKVFPLPFPRLNHYLYELILE